MRMPWSGRVPVGRRARYLRASSSPRHFVRRPKPSRPSRASSETHTRPAPGLEGQPPPPRSTMAPAAHRADARRGRIEDGPAAVVDADLAPPACDQPPLPAPISRASTAALAPHRHHRHHPPQWRAHSLSENPNTYNASLHRSNRQHGHVSSTTWELLLPVEDIANRWCHHPQQLLVSSLATLGMRTMGAAVLGTLP